jgi:hypothetical protein
MRLSGLGDHSSSLAAYILCLLGLVRATDLARGSLPVVVAGSATTQPAARGTLIHTASLEIA